MVDIKEFLKKGFIEAVGKMEDYKIRINSIGWFEKGYLSENDINEINEAIESQYKINEIIEEIPIEEIMGGIENLDPEEVIEETESQENV